MPLARPLLVLLALSLGCMPGSWPSSIALAVDEPLGSCPGDCGGDGVVAVDELLRGVSIALGAASETSCRAFDRDRDDRVEIHELVAAVAAALQGCSGLPPSPTPTPCNLQISGRVLDPDGATIANARVTLTNEDGSAFREVRTDEEGRYALSSLPPGRHLLGVSALRRAFREQAIELQDTCLQLDVTLGSETHPGRWDVVGDPGDTFGGTDSGVLLPDGRIMWCHDTEDPVIFDAVAPQGDRFFLPPASPTIQGCHAVTVLPDGRVLYVGGADQPVYGPGTKQVKLYDPARNQWQAMPAEQELVDARWYPSMAPLPDGGLIAVGGGGLDNPVRIRTSEVLDPDTMRWRRVGDIALGNEVSPIVLLFTGEVLMTHRPPQLYDPISERWRLAVDFVQGNRMPNGDHADHEIVMLADGRVVAVGYKSFSEAPGMMVEVYDPVDDRWRLSANVSPVRSRPSILLLPDHRVLVLGGRKEEASDPTPVNPWGQVALTDLYDPATDRWRRLNDLNVAREYHALPILIPDGRVVVVGGEEEPGREPTRSTVEIFSPPYLFRGPRPRIVDLEQTSFRRGERFRFRIERTAAPTRVALIGAVATTHFMDSGPGRYLDLEFEQGGDEISARIPEEPARAVDGYYILFVLVDDIPSEGVVVRVADS